VLALVTVLCSYACWTLRRGAVGPVGLADRHGSWGGRWRGDDAKLLIDQVLPRSDLAVAHAGVVPVQPEVCYQTACRLDLFQVPRIRTLIGLRGLPQRLAGALTGHRSVGAPARPRLRLGDDLAGLGFVLLGETPGVVELLWGR
jgi:hypothetical protein